MKKLFLFFIFLIISVSFVTAVPKLPVIVSGKVYINDKIAPIGTEITAITDGKEVANFKVATKGEFSFLIQKLEEGKLIKFYVDGIDTNVEVDYKSGDFQNLDLAVEKSYSIYVIGGLIALLIALGVIFLIWKLKRK